MKIQSFPALSNPAAEVLLLGTMPGVLSLAINEYYGHPRNYFWKLLAAIFDEEIPPSYELKKALLQRNKIAVWDVLQACEREGSLDNNIRKENPNDFAAFLNEHPQIKLIAFNGQKAAAFFKNTWAFPERTATSPCRQPARQMPVKALNRNSGSGS